VGVLRDLNNDGKIDVVVSAIGDMPNCLQTKHNSNGLDSASDDRRQKAREDWHTASVQEIPAWCNTTT